MFLGEGGMMKAFTFDKIAVGQTASFEKTLTSEDVLLFSSLTGDANPLHLDDSYAKSAGFSSRVAFGMLGSSLHSALAGMHLPGKYCLIVKEESNFIAPFFPGDTLTVMGTVKDKKPFGNLLFINTEMKNQDSRTVIRGKLVVKVLK